MKCNFIIHKKISNKYAYNFKKYVLMNNKHVFIIIDLKTINNFISQQLINKLKITTKFKKNLYNLIIINENLLLNNNKQILQKIVLITLIISDYKK